MSKRFKSKPCVYCGVNPSTTTGDHVFAREFFPVGKRGNLPKVPACERCNGEKSVLEHYLTAVLPFGGRHGDAKENLESMVPARLEKNKRLHRELAGSQTRVLSKQPSGLVVPTTAIALDGDRVLKLCGFIAKGLLWHHWGIRLSPDHGVRALSVTKHGEDAFAPLFALGARDRATGNLGDSAFVYEGAQGKDDPELSVWKLEILGGLTMAGEHSEEMTSIVIMTAKKSFLESKPFIETFGADDED